MNHAAISDVITTTLKIAIIAIACLPLFHLVPLTNFLVRDAVTCDASQCASFVETALANQSTDVGLATAVIFLLLGIGGLIVYIVYLSETKDTEHRLTKERLGKEHQATRDAHAKTLKNKEDAFNRVKHGLVDYINAEQSLQYIDVKKFDAWFKDMPSTSQYHLLEHTREIPFSLFTSEHIVESNTPVVEGMSSFYYCLLMLTLRFGVPGSASQSSSEQVVLPSTS